PGRPLPVGPTTPIPTRITGRRNRWSGTYGRYSNLVGWHGMEERRLRFVPPDQVSLTPAQRSTAWYFFAVAALFLVQTLLGGATAHYHADDGSFFGIDLAQLLPYNLSRTWHLQLALFVVSAAFLAGSRTSCKNIDNSA